MIERYDNLDRLRAISCIAIIAMHIRANADYQMNDWVYHNVVGAWGNLADNLHRDLEARMGAGAEEAFCPKSR